MNFIEDKLNDEDYYFTIGNIRTSLLSYFNDLQDISVMTLKNYLKYKLTKSFKKIYFKSYEKND